MKHSKISLSVGKLKVASFLDRGVTKPGRFGRKFPSVKPLMKMLFSLMKQFSNNQAFTHNVVRRNRFIATTIKVRIIPQIQTINAVRPLFLAPATSPAAYALSAATEIEDNTSL